MRPSWPAPTIPIRGRFIGGERALTRGARVGLLEHVRRPATYPPDGEGGREQLDPQPDAVQDQGGVELDVRAQVSSGIASGQEAFSLEFDRTSEGEPFR